MNRNVHVPFLGEGQRKRWPLTRLRAVVPPHLKHPGVHMGRVAVKANGSFTVTTKHGKVPDIGYRYCQLLQRADGYTYLLGRKEEAASSPSLGKG